MMKKTMRTLALLTLTAILALPVSLPSVSAQGTSSTYRVREAFYKDRQVYYYVFENGTPIEDEGARVGLSTQYRLVDTEGEPIPDQLDIIGQGPWETGYSDLRELIEVTVPADYEANTITSVEDLLAEDWPQASTGNAHNIPIARTNSQLQGLDMQPVAMWLNGEQVEGYDFGVNPAESAPIYVLISGFDDDGNPIQIDHKPVIKQMHSDEGYSDFWQVIFVTVPADTAPDSIRNFDDIEAAGYELTPTPNVINCPALLLADLAVAYFDGVAYNITHVLKLDMIADEDMPSLYAYTLDDGVPNLDAPLILTVGGDDDAYTGYCEEVSVFGTSAIVFDATTLEAQDSARFVPQTIVATCAYLSPVIE